MTRSAATVSRFGVAAVCAALAVAAGCGGQFWTIERTRSLEELSASEIELICERYEGDDTTCPGGWEAGFDSVGQCTGWLERFQSSELYTCRRMQAGEVYDCLDVPPCERPRHELCEELFMCVLHENAAADGVELDTGYYY